MNMILSPELETLPKNFLKLSNFCAELSTITLALKDEHDTALENRWTHDMKLLLLDSPGIPFDIGHTIYPVFLASAFTIAKNSRLIDLLTRNEINRMDFLMEVMVYLSAFASNDCNDFRTTLELQGDYNKHGGANYRFSAVMPIVYAMFYFGDAPANVSHIDEMLMAFDVNDVLTRAERFGYTALIDRWNTEIDVSGMTLKAKDYIGYIGSEEQTIYCENIGNLSYGGKGIGIRHPYTYFGISTEKFIYEFIEDGRHYHTSSSVRILCALLTDCFNSANGSIITSEIDENGDGDPEVYILDRSKSPVEGKIGMMRAFNDGSAYPRLRSSGIFAQLEASLAINAIATMTALDPYMVKYGIHPKRDYRFTIQDCPSTYERVNNGLIDCAYKLERGYHSKAMGRYYDWFEDNSWSWLNWKEYAKENIFNKGAEEC